MKNNFNVLIIGAGRIGAFFDTPESENILTHAHAFFLSKNFNLIGFVDVNLNASQKAANVWRTEYFSTIDEAFSKYQIDVVCVASPDETHFLILKQLSSYPVKLVFSEKPLTKNLDESFEIINIYNDNNIPLLVNYSRRFVPEFQILRDEIQSGKWGNFIGGSGYYGKGILHNGSHMIDLLRFLLNSEIISAQTLASIYDFYQDDPSVDAILKFDNDFKFYMRSIDCNWFTVFELDLLFERGRVKIDDLGLVIKKYDINENKFFSGYKTLTITNDIQTALAFSLKYSAQNIFNYLTNKENLLCSGDDAYQAMKVCIALQKGDKACNVVQKNNSVCL